MPECWPGGVLSAGGDSCCRGHPAGITLSLRSELFEVAIGAVSRYGFCESTARSTESSCHRLLPLHMKLPISQASSW